MKPFALVLVVSVVLAGCGQASGSRAVAPAGGTPAVSDKPSGWDELVAAAEQEGTLTVYAPPGTSYRAVIVDAFEQAYPRINVQATYSLGNDHLQRVMAERTAGRYLADVEVSGPGTLTQNMKPAGVLVPLRPLLLLPEILDPSAWFQNELWWSDETEPLTTLQFVGNTGTVAYYNTDMIDPSQFRSYWDFLDPRWKGKIIATDIRNIGPGSTPATVMYKDPQLGPAFLERLFGEMDLILSSDQRQMVDWLAQGQYPIALFISGGEVARAVGQGLPLAGMPSSQFRESGVMSSGFGCVVIFDRAPHPNAAQLYANWLLSRDGQIAWQQATNEPSLRVDIPKGDNLIFPPEPGVRYLNGSLDRYATVTADSLRPLIESAIQRQATTKR